MDPQFDKSPGLGLPQPSIEQGVATTVDYQDGSRSPEAAPVIGEMAPVAPQTAAPLIPTVVPPATPMQTPAAPAIDTSASGPTASAAADDDADALDAEWVSKAKAIVERTKNDPFLESKELSKAKAEYLRIRYNKHIKVAEDNR
jgi:hypothetical protein